MSAETSSSRSSAEWHILEKLGGGYSGETFRVCRETEGGKVYGLLKRPYQDHILVEKKRQARQIETEGQALDALKVIQYDSRHFQVRAVHLLDRSQGSADQPQEYFIVQELAAGIPLNTLAEVSRYGRKGNALLTGDLKDSERMFVEGLAENKEVFHLLVLRALYGLHRFLDVIHNLECTIAGQTKRGILWNDIKADHLFWDF